MKEISQERAAVVARSIACARCGEYSFKKLRVLAAREQLREEIGEVWHVVRECGVCGAHEELGLDAEGDLVY